MSSFAEPYKLKCSGPFPFKTLLKKSHNSVAFMLWCPRGHSWPPWQNVTLAPSSHTQILPLILHIHGPLQGAAPPVSAREPMTTHSPRVYKIYFYSIINSISVFCVFAYPHKVKPDFLHHGAQNVSVSQLRGMSSLNIVRECYSAAKIMANTKHRFQKYALRFPACVSMVMSACCCLCSW